MQNPLAPSPSPAPDKFVIRSDCGKYMNAAGRLVAFPAAHIFHSRNKAAFAADCHTARFGRWFTVAPVRDGRPIPPDPARV